MTIDSYRRRLSGSVKTNPVSSYRSSTRSRSCHSGALSLCNSNKSDLKMLQIYMHTRRLNFRCTEQQSILDPYRHHDLNLGWLNGLYTYQSFSPRSATTSPSLHFSPRLPMSRPRVWTYKKLNFVVQLSPRWRSHIVYCTIPQFESSGKCWTMSVL